MLKQRSSPIIVAILKSRFFLCKTWQIEGAKTQCQYSLKTELSGSPGLLNFAHSDSVDLATPECIMYML